MEKWKNIPGYEGIYEISNLGRIKSYYAKNGRLTSNARLISGKLDKDGYCEIKLCKNGKIKYTRLHRLVAESFVDGDASLEVNHKDGDKLNNIASNLEWVTTKENIDHAHLIGLHKGCRTKVIIENNKTKMLFESINEAAEYVGHHRSWFRDKTLKLGNPFLHDGYIITLVGGKCGLKNVVC